MRIRLTCNVAGDIRLQCLADKPHSTQIDTGAGALLVCSREVQEMTTPVSPLARVGFGRISQRYQFTRHARAVIRQLGCLLDNGPRSNLIFLTGTLPGGTPDAMAALAAWSGWLRQSVLQWIRDYSPDCQYFGVWEYQKRGALHIHLCIRTGSEAESRFLKTAWKARWIKLLDAVSKRSGVDVYARANGGSWSDSKWLTRTDAQTVEKSVSAYLGKYLSKGQCKLRNQCQAPPSAWYFASLPLRQAARLTRRALEVTQLHLTQAIGLFEKIGSILAESAGRCFAYANPYDVRSKGLIGLTSPIHARMLWDLLADNLRLLKGTDTIMSGCIISAVDAAKLVFSVIRAAPNQAKWGTNFS